MLRAGRSRAPSSSWKVVSVFLGGPKDVIKMTVHEEEKTLEAMKMVYNVRSASLDVEKDLYEKSVVPSVMHGVEM